MNNDKITINLLRVSPDSKYLEFSVECPKDYRFNLLHIKRYDYEEVANYPSSSPENDGNNDGWLDAKAAYKGASTKEVVRIATSVFKGSSMFYVKFGVRWVGRNGEEPEGTIERETKLSDRTTIAVCSDVTTMYHYLLNHLLSFDDDCTKCFDLSREVKNAFIILFGHIEAMRLERFEDAEQFYTTLKNNFSHCIDPNKDRSNLNKCGC